MSSSGTEENLEDTTSSFTFVVYMILITAIIFIFVPCFCCVTQRRVCMRRIRQRQWDVDTDDIEEPNPVFTLRYPRGDPRHTATKEDAEKAKKEYIIGKLQDYTKVCLLSFY